MSGFVRMAIRQESQDDLSSIIIPVACGCLGLSMLMVAVRLYTRIFLVKKVGLDDYLAAATMVFLCGQGIAITMNTSYGLGRHQDTLTDESMRLYDMTFYVSVVLYVACLLLVKATLLTQYYRLFSVQSARIVYIGAIVLITTWSVAQLFLTVFTCIPVSAFWDKSQEGETCLPATIMAYINAGGNILTEFAILMLPLPVLGGLNLARRTRTVLIFVFSLGFLTIAISGVRIKYLDLEDDRSYNNAIVACLSIAEITCALTCACLLTLRPVISRALPRRSSIPPLQPPYKENSYTRTSTRDSYRNSPAMRFLATMESREGLYDDKYMMTADSYEIESRSKKSGSFSSDESTLPKVKRSRSTNDFTEKIRKLASIEKKDSKEQEENEWEKIFGEKSWADVGIGLRPSVTTEIIKTPPPARRSKRPTVPKWEIGVMREIYQTTASRC